MKKKSDVKLAHDLNQTAVESIVGEWYSKCGQCTLSPRLEIIKMRSLLVVTVLLTLLCGIPSAWAQEPKEAGSITGRVTLDGKPAKDITVIANLSITDPSKIAESFLNKAA